MGEVMDTTFGGEGDRPLSEGGGGVKDGTIGDGYAISSLTGDGIAGPFTASAYGTTPLERFKPGEDTDAMNRRLPVTVRPNATLCFRSWSSSEDWAVLRVWPDLDDS